MSLPTDLILINGTRISHLAGYDVTPEKLWTDAGRNMVGNLISTFLGIFPKISLSFTPMKESELRTILSLLKLPSFTVSYWDAESQTMKSGTFYAGDYTYPLYSRRDQLYNTWKVDLISFNNIS